MFYVYAYLRQDDFTPYYIGKGTKLRAWQKHNVIVPTDRNRIVIVADNLTEVGAFALERRLIQWYGRKDIGTGILRNLTEGGEGSSGRKYIQPQSTRDKVSAALTGKPKSLEHVAKNKASHMGQGLGRVLSEETKQRMRKPKSDEAKRNMSIAAKHRKPLSEEHKQAQFGRVTSEESRLKMSLAKKGIKRGPYNKKRKLKND